MENTADYKLNEIMDQGGAKSSEDLIMKVFQNLLNLPVSASDSKMDYGCSAFCVKSPDGDVIVGRNFDYRFVSSANVAVHNIFPGAYESMCISAMPYLDEKTFVAGSLSDGTTDISVPIAASVYCCLDGMNDAGLFIGVLSLRGGGAVHLNTFYDFGGSMDGQKQASLRPDRSLQWLLSCTKSDEEPLSISVFSFIENSNH